MVMSASVFRVKGAKTSDSGISVVADSGEKVRKIRQLEKEFWLTGFAETER